MIRAVSKEIRDEILGKVKQGVKVAGLASQYGLSSRTIYGWLARSVVPPVTWAKYLQLKKENEELKKIIGMISLDLELEKKRKVSSGLRQ